MQLHHKVFHGPDAGDVRLKAKKWLKNPLPWKTVEVIEQRQMRTTKLFAIIIFFVIKES